MEYRNLHGTDIDLLAVAFGSVMVALFSAAAVAGPLFVDDTDRAGVRYSGCGKGVAMADIDNDGDLDIVIGNVRSQNVAFFNDGTSINFVEVRFGSPEDITYGVGVGDVNGDGFPDIGVANSDGLNGIHISRPSRTQ